MWPSEANAINMYPISALSPSLTITPFVIDPTTKTKAAAAAAKTQSFGGRYI